MYDENTLRKMAADAIRTGKVPARRALRTWAGTGSGCDCAVCNLPVNPDEVEFELDFGDAAETATCRVHAHCFAAWEFERRNFAAPPHA